MRFAGSRTLTVRGATLLCVLGALLAATWTRPAAASAAATITFVPPSGARVYPDSDPEGPVGYDEAPTAFRTTHSRPTIRIEANGGTTLECHPDSVWVTQPCGPAPPSCAAAVCASYRPDSPLTGNQYGHFLAVDLLDSGGETVASVWLNLEVDTTPPITRVISLGNHNPFRPRVRYEVKDDNHVGGTGVDHAKCSWERYGVAPSWAQCPSVTSPVLPKRHRLYEFKVRGSDDFGRSTTASTHYDPIPCAISIHRPANLARLLSAGIRVKVRCDAITRAAVAVHVFAVNRHPIKVPPGDLPIAGQFKLKSGGSLQFGARRHLRLSKSARRALRRAHSVGLVLVAGRAESVTHSIPDRSLSQKTLTVRR